MCYAQLAAFRGEWDYIDKNRDFYHVMGQNEPFTLVSISGAAITRFITQFYMK